MIRPRLPVFGLKSTKWSPWPKTRYSFSTSSLLREEETHYQILDLEPSASPADIKRQYFHLSKLHHPDRNPSDPAASNRFMRISEAYATLSNEQKRSRYDRSITPAANTSSPRSTVPHGSHSSASTPYGARAASGLSRRRTQFKGPPPSFFKNGGGRKTSHTGSNSSSRAESEGPGGGMGYGQGFGGSEVPHFDQEGHFRTQMGQEERIIQRRRRMGEEYEGSGGAADVAGRFLLVSAILGLAFVPVLLLSGGRGREIAKKSKET